MRVQAAEQNFLIRPLTEILYDDISRVETCIRSQIQTYVPLLNSVAAHILGSRGKRIRPLVCLASAQLTGQINSHVISVASALELIHTATLLHDDVIDNSTMRRGHDTANIRFGNVASILSGDYLFSKAFELMVSAQDLEVLRILSSISATISQGEIDQLAALECIITKDRYLDIIEAKTASLFAAACRTGALLGGANLETQELMHAFGAELGLAFQIIDDILDYEGDIQKIGKTIGNDFLEGKMTLPIILAMENGIELDQWKKYFRPNTQRSIEDFREVTDTLKTTGVLTLAREFARKIIEKALENLYEAVPPRRHTEEVYESLRMLTEQLLERTS